MRNGDLLGRAVAEHGRVDRDGRLELRRSFIRFGFLDFGDHVHSARVSPDSVKRSAAASYLVHGADHDNAFSLKAEDMRQLELGKTVTVRTSSAAAHVHDVTVRC